MSYTPDNIVRFCPVPAVPDNTVFFGECNYVPINATIATDVVIATWPGIISDATLRYIPPPAFISTNIVIATWSGVISNATLEYVPPPAFISTNIVIATWPVVVPNATLEYIPPPTLSTNIVITAWPEVISDAELLHIQPASISTDIVIDTWPVIERTGRLFYDSLVIRQVVLSNNIRYSEGYKAHKQITQWYSTNKQVTHTTQSFYNQTKLTQTIHFTRWFNIRHVSNSSDILYSNGIKTHSIKKTLWTINKLVYAHKSIRYSTAKPVINNVKIYYHHLQHVAMVSHVNYSHATKAHAVLFVHFNKALPLNKRLNIAYTHAIPLTVGRSVKSIETPIPPVILRCGNTIIFRPFGRVNAVKFYKCGSVIYVPVKEVYIVSNTFSLIRTSDSLPIQTLSFSMSLDSDSFAWQWNATVNPSQVNSLLSIEQFDPIDLLATINGTQFRLILEKVSKSRSFGSKSLAVSGRGHTAYLAAPYADINTVFTENPIDASQAAYYAVTVPTGWIIDWQLDDWHIENPSAWNNTGTYIEHLARLAEAGGGYLQPHDTDNIVKIKKYYPTVPWSWNTPEIVLPEDVITTEGIEYSFKPNYNGVFVHGGASGGVLDFIKITDTPGDKQAPIVVDDLATHSIMTRQRGIRVLSDTGKIAMVSISLPILSQTGIIRPGTLIQYLGKYGMVRGVSVSYGLEKVRQTLEVETHEYL